MLNLSRGELTPTTADEPNWCSIDIIQYRLEGGREPPEACQATDHVNDVMLEGHSPRYQNSTATDNKITNLLWNRCIHANRDASYGLHYRTMLEPSYQTSNMAWYTLSWLVTIQGWVTLRPMRSADEPVDVDGSLREMDDTLRKLSELVRWSSTEATALQPQDDRLLCISIMAQRATASPPMNLPFHAPVGEQSAANILHPDWSQIGDQVCSSRVPSEAKARLEEAKATHEDAEVRELLRDGAGSCTTMQVALNLFEADDPSLALDCRILVEACQTVTKNEPHACVVDAAPSQPMDGRRGLWFSTFSAPESTESTP
ncbi:MAG: hypothetical protein H6741_31100 [Alphaproteobacteria bacterium]|nr:hypothetical protein [Alphaproteobacteria bacterium]